VKKMASNGAPIIFGAATIACGGVKGLRKG